MLLVYDGVSDEHVAYVKAFWHFLRETLGVSNVLLDVIDIAHDSPFNWYQIISKLCNILIFLTLCLC